MFVYKYFLIGYHTSSHMINIICMTINHKPKLHSDCCTVKKIQVRILNCAYNTIESAGVCKRDCVIDEPNRGLAQWLMLTTHTLMYAEMPKQADLMHLQGIIKCLCNAFGLSCE